MRLLALALTLFATAAPAHEFWLEPLTYEVQPDGKLQAHLVNGEKFEGFNLAYLPQSFTRFELREADTVFPVENRIGARPALDLFAPAEGLAVVAYVSDYSRLTYDDFAVFERFVAHKDLGNALEPHLDGRLPQTGFTEVYTRFAKTLIAVGDGAGSDSRFGLETEFVALTNPYTDDLTDGMQVQLFYGEYPRMDAQVELFDKAPDGTVEITYHRTDSNGIVALPVTPGHSYLVDAVVLREPALDLAEVENAVWESLWAALTFAVPD